jgi:dienelactone hydrolase
MPRLTGELPSALVARARWERLGPARVPAMIVMPDPAPGLGEPVAAPDENGLAPAVIWMHGRTARKEIDPGRCLRLMRAGIGVCALDLPGHGERAEPRLQEPEHTLEVVLRMEEELDGIVAALETTFDPARLAIGGMSAGGMAAIRRLCRSHPFQCASVEATSGSWAHQRDREMFHGRTEELARLDPIGLLAGWREIPFQAIHARHDAAVAIAGQRAFVDALRARYADPASVEMVVFERTGAEQEHAGFGRHAAEAKARQRDFFARWLARPAIAAILIVLAVLAAPLRAQEAPIAEHPPRPSDVLLVPASIDLGRAAPSSAVPARFWIISRADRPLAIEAVKGNCGCITVAGFAPDIPRRGAREIRFTITAPNAPGLDKTKDVHVIVEGERFLEIAVKVGAAADGRAPDAPPKPAPAAGPLRVAPDVLDVTADAGATAKASCWLINTGAQPVTLRSARGGDGARVLLGAPVTVPAGEAREVPLSLTAPKEPGAALTTSITLAAEHGVLQVPVRVRAAPKVAEEAAGAAPAGGILPP